MTTTSVGDPLVGHVLDGRYRILGRLARGGMATVYSAEDLRLQRVVALKLMHVGLGDDAEFSRKFDREARAAARLSHPNVVAVFDQGADNGRPYIVMEYVAGHTLRDVISRESPIAPLRALELIEPVLSALAAAHEAGLVHRDVKPENVLISARGQMKVADFGLARAITAQTSTATAGLLIGTVSYLPPELVTSGRADARSDVYSAGIVLFEMLTGRKPHVGETPIQVAWAHVNTDVPRPSSVTAAYPIPPYLDALILGATARNADARPHDARVLLSQVRRVRFAIRNGVADDPELTSDLTIPLATLQRRSHSAGDASATVVVPPRRPSPAEEALTTPVPRQPTPNPVPEAVPEPPNFFSRYATAQQGPAPTFAEPEQTDRSTVARAAARPLTPERFAAHDLRRRRRRLQGSIALILVLLLTALVALTSWYFTRGRFTATPGLTNLSQSAAIRAAGTDGLTLRFDSVYSETVASGRVVTTEPAPGNRIAKGGVLHVLLSRGPERHPVPKLAGLPSADAQQALTAVALRPGRVSTAYSDTVPQGNVLSSGRPAGTLLRRDTPVDLVVSAGPRPIPVVDYTGKDAADATRALGRAGFRVTTTAVHSDAVAKGQVIAQSPRSGTGHKGDAISLTTSLGPVLVPVPSVRAMGIRAATLVLEQAGFQVRRRPVQTNFLGVGYVAYTDPGAGSRVPRGSTVTLYYV